MCTCIYKGTLRKQETPNYYVRLADVRKGSLTRNNYLLVAMLVKPLKCRAARSKATMR